MSNPNKRKQDLERLMAKYFDEYQSLQLLRNQLNEALKTGYFLMSKSRMSMGMRSLGQLQYPENMKSTVLIQKPIDSDSYVNLTLDCYTRQTEKEESTHHHKQQEKKQQQQQQQQKPVLQEDDEEDRVSPFSQYDGTVSYTTTKTQKKSQEAEEEAESQTRKRNTASSNNGSQMKSSTSMNRIEQLLNSATLTESFTSNGVKSNQTDDHTTDDGEYDDYSSDDYSDDDKDRVSQKMVSLTNRTKRQKQKSLKANPIYWFGFLTPNTLKQSQNQFSQAVTLSIEISNKMARMDAIQNRYFEILQME